MVKTEGTDKMNLRTWIGIILVSSQVLLLLGLPVSATIPGQENTTSETGQMFDSSGSSITDTGSLPVTQAVVSGPSVSGVPIFPTDHIWNTRVDTLPVDPRSADYVGTIGSTAYMHADFGSGLWEAVRSGFPIMS